MDDLRNTTGRVHSVETFGLVDGPGVRFVVFLSGCRMRCRYCHNPDTWSRPGREQTAGELLRQALKYKPYWKNNGGITVSGGEPLLQPEFLVAFLTLCKEQGIHTAVDTAGEPFREEEAYLSRFDRLLPVTDLFLLDLKVMDSGAHRSLTGVDNQNILAFARYLSEHNKKLWIRHVLVPGLTDHESDLLQMHDFIGTLKTVERVEVLPYHTLGVHKWQELGLDYPLEGVPTPTEKEVERCRRLLLNGKP